MKSLTKHRVFLLLFLIFLLSSCAQQHDLSFNEDPKGFLYGLLHGVIACFTFIVSIFSDTVSVYEVNNNGFWYDLGFLLGIGAFSSSAGRASKRR